MKEYVAKKTCYWGPQAGAESLVIIGTSVMAHGTEPHLDEFFELVKKEEPVQAPAPKPKGLKGKRSSEDFNDI